MEYRSQNNGLPTFLEHWWLLILGASAILATQVLEFFTRLTGAPWNWCYAIALTSGAVGVSLIFYAKLPLYRQRQFFTLGSRALPENRRIFYRWGYRCVLSAVVLLACLFLSSP